MTYIFVTRLERKRERGRERERRKDRGREQKRKNRLSRANMKYGAGDFLLINAMICVFRVLECAMYDVETMIRLICMFVIREEYVIAIAF